MAATDLTTGRHPWKEDQMNRKLLLTPLLLATMASFGANAADAGSSSRFSSGSRSTGLLGINADNGSANRSLLNARSSNASNNGLTSLGNRDSSSNRSLLAGLNRSDSSSSSLGDRLPKITTSNDSGDGKLSRTLNVDGNNGNLSITNGVERSGQTLSERLQQSGDDSTQSLDRSLKLTSNVTASSSRDSGGDSNALGLGRERSSDRNYSQSSSLSIGRSGSATPASGDDKASRDVTRTITSDNQISSSLDRSVAPLTDSGETRNTSRSRDTRYGFKSSNGSQREGLTVTDRQRSFEPNFKTESDG
jgi:hypothetical protein